MTEAQDRAFERLTEIQRRGLDAAGSLVERLVATVDGVVPRRDPEQGDQPVAPPDAVDELVSGWAKLWRDSLNGLVAGLPATGAKSARLDVQAAGPPPTITARLDAGGRAAVEVWVHNPSAEAYDKLRVHCGAPLTHDGAALDALTITVEPDVFDLPGRASRGIVLAIEAPDAVPGAYRGIVLVDGLPDQWLVLEVDVPEPAS